MPRLITAWMLASLLTGCGAPLSNRLLEEDVLFRASLPAPEDVATTAPEDEADGARDLGERAQLVKTTKAVSSLYNGIVWSLLGVVDSVVQSTPSRREDDRRVWGPFAGRKAGTSSILVVQRAQEGVFSYSIDGAAVPRWAADEDTEWVPIMTGTFTRGDSLREGEGQFVLDAAAWGIIDSRFDGGAGQLAVAHTRRGEAVALDVVVAGWLTERHGELDASYRFRRSAAGDGFFEYDTVDEVVGNGGEPESYIVRARWTPGRAGRGDFLLRGLGDGAPGAECWDEDLGRTWWSFDPPGTEFDQLEGVETDCVIAFEQPGDPAPEIGAE